jgi:hypothetical protein
VLVSNRDDQQAYEKRLIEDAATSRAPPRRTPVSQPNGEKSC